MKITTPDGVPRQVDDRPYMIVGYGPDNLPHVLLVDEHGALVVAGGGGSAPTGAATEAKQDNQIEVLTDSRDRQFALNGGQAITSGAPVTGSFYVLKAVTDCVIDSITFDTGWTGEENLTGVALVPGQTIEVGFTSIELTSGVAMIYANPTPTL